MRNLKSYENVDSDVKVYYKIKDFIDEYFKDFLNYDSLLKDHQVNNTNVTRIWFSYIDSSTIKHLEDLFNNAEKGIISKWYIGNNSGVNGGKTGGVIFNILIPLKNIDKFLEFMDFTFQQEKYNL